MRSGCRGPRKGIVAANFTWDRISFQVIQLPLNLPRHPPPAGRFFCFRFSTSAGLFKLLIITIIVLSTPQKLSTITIQPCRVSYLSDRLQFLARRGWRSLSGRARSTMATPILHIANRVQARQASVRLHLTCAAIAEAIVLLNWPQFFLCSVGRVSGCKCRVLSAKGHTVAFWTHRHPCTGLARRRRFPVNLSPSSKQTEEELCSTDLCHRTSRTVSDFAQDGIVRPIKLMKTT